MANLHFWLIGFFLEKESENLKLSLRKLNNFSFVCSYVSFLLKLLAVQTKMLNILG